MYQLGLLSLVVMTIGDAVIDVGPAHPTTLADARSASPAS
jgi:hypothetical protein